MHCPRHSGRSCSGTPAGRIPSHTAAIEGVLIASRSLRWSCVKVPPSPASNEEAPYSDDSRFPVWVRAHFFWNVHFPSAWTVTTDGPPSKGTVPAYLPISLTARFGIGLSECWMSRDATPAAMSAFTIPPGGISSYTTIQALPTGALRRNRKCHHEVIRGCCGGGGCCTPQLRRLANWMKALIGGVGAGCQPGEHGRHASTPPRVSER